MLACWCCDCFQTVSSLNDLAPSLTVIHSAPSQDSQARSNMKYSHAETVVAPQTERFYSFMTCHGFL